jgi:hypothetical protein
METDMKTTNEQKSTTEKSAACDPKAASKPFQVKEPTAKPLLVSEFDRAPLTDVNFGF